MKTAFGWGRGCVAALALILLLPPKTAAAPEASRYYKTGLASVEAGNWEQVDELMRRAIEERPGEKRRRGLRRRGYFPHYYLGLARYHLRDCPGALASWAESEDQGVIIGRDEYSELLRLKADCQKNGRPTLGKNSSGSVATPSSEPPPQKTGKEKVRTVQKVVEKGADPTKKTLSAVERAAPEGSHLGKVAGTGQKVVDVAVAATDIVDLVLSPSEKLEAAINAYFVGNPQRTLALLEGIDISDPRAKAQVLLFRSAASFRLHLLAGKDKAHLRSARKNADLFQQEQWRDDFPAKLFDPRFVRFLRGRE